GMARNRIAAFADSIRANPTIAAVSAEGFLTRLGFSMVGFALPLYALSLGMGIAEVGFLYALRTATTIIVKPMMGRVADRFGRKYTLVGAVALRCLVGLLLVFATRPWHLYALRILHGTMTAARDPSALALIAEHGDKRSMASAFAWNTTARELGRSLGYGVAGLLLQATGSYRLIFLLSFLTSCAALVTVIQYVVESRESKDTPSREAECAPPPEPDGRAHRGLQRYASFGLMVAGTAEMMQGLFPIIATQYAHLTEGHAGLAASASSVAILVAGPLFGWLSDHVSRRLALGARSFANSFSSLLYIFVPTFGGFLAARVLDDTGKAAYRPTWGAILAEVSDADPAHRARTMSFVDTAATLGEALGPLGAGLLITGFGVPVMLGVRAALAVVTEVQSVRVFRQGALSSKADGRPGDAVAGAGEAIE
ncbi:MAG TPA: MFS transporter, partial [Candidatus Acidoferrum sp.]|nr:MFS transporter [Candidatus Acidoferrum sp.]